MKPTIVFFGSFQNYSTQILQKLHQSNLVEVVGVVTTPPQPAGRSQTLTPTPVQTYANTHHLPLFTPDKLTNSSLKDLRSTISDLPDLIVVAGYGKLLPPSWLSTSNIAALNIHFSLLPRYRGANPGEWAILMGDKYTGVTLITMSDKFDTGNIISQTIVPLSPQDTRVSLYHKLYSLGADLTLATLPLYLEWKHHQKNLNHKLKFKNTLIFLPPKIQPKSAAPYAHRLNRTHSFVPWHLIAKALAGKTIVSTDTLPPLLNDVVCHLKTTSPSSPLAASYAHLLESAIRALADFPGVWTEVATQKGKKRLKLLTAHLAKQKLILDHVQLEGHQKSTYNQIKTAIT